MFHERLTHSLHCSEFIELTLIVSICKNYIMRHFEKLFIINAVLMISMSLNLYSQNQEQNEVAKFYVTNAVMNGIDVTERVLESGIFTVFYEVDNIPYMANCSANEDSQSYGRIYNIHHTNNPETTTEYETDVFRFSWSYSNTYDSKTGTCQCELVKIYKPQGVVSILRMIAESLDVTEYTGFMEGSLNINW